MSTPERAMRAALTIPRGPLPLTVLTGPLAVRTALLGLAVLSGLLAASPATAQLGVTNPTSVLSTVPFGTQPNAFNNPYPTLPNAGTNYAWQYGTPLRHLWVGSQTVVLRVYVPAPEGVPDQWRTDYVEVPGYYVTETTTGLYYPERWTIDQLNVGVYQWRRLPAEFRVR